jgi:hypothetical protein
VSDEQSPTVKELERQVLADIKAQEQYKVAAEVAKRRQQFEAAYLLREREAERARARLLKPMEQQAIFGVALSRVKRMLRPTYPLEHLPLPEEVVVILEGAFGIDEGAPTLLSNVVTTLIRCLVTGEGEHRRQARQRGQQGLEGEALGPFVDVPIVADWPGDASPAVCVQLVCGWALGYKERQDAQNALRQGE